MRLRVLIGALGGAHGAGMVIDEVMALRRAVDSVGPMQPGVEPLRRVGRADLASEHYPDLVVEGACGLLAVEITALPAPIAPGSSHAVEDLPGAGFAAIAGVFGQARHTGGVGGTAP